MNVFLSIYLPTITVYVIVRVVLKKKLSKYDLYSSKRIKILDCMQSGRKLIFSISLSKFLYSPYISLSLLNKYLHDKLL